MQILYNEIGTRSPQLWKMLLQRHGWPETVTVNDQEGGEMDNDSPCYIALCREAYIPTIGSALVVGDVVVGRGMDFFWNQSSDHST